MSEDCHELDDRAWRAKECTDEYVKGHMGYSVSERWGDLDAPGAWTSALELCSADATRTSLRTPGPTPSRTSSTCRTACTASCGRTAGTSAATLAMQCHDVTAPACYHVLNSLSRIYDLGWNLYRAVENAVQCTKDSSILYKFGLPPADSIKPSLQIILDIFLMVFGLVSGFHRNKGQLSSPPPPSLCPTRMSVLLSWCFVSSRVGLGKGGENARHLKDQANDLTKNSVVLGKDIHTASLKAYVPRPGAHSPSHRRSTR